MRRGCTFLTNDRLIKQVDECQVSGLISVVLSNIPCVIMEIDAVKPIKSNLYKCYINDIVNGSKINQLNFLNNYHPYIKLTIKVNPSRFLDSEIMIKNGITETSVLIKESKNRITCHQQAP